MHPHLQAEYAAALEKDKLAAGRSSRDTSRGTIRVRTLTPSLFAARRTRC